MAGLNGIFYSLLLAAIFAPAYAVLRLQVHRLAALVDPATGVSGTAGWIREHRLDMNISQQLKSLATALAPAIVGGPLLNVISAIAGP